MNDNEEEYALIGHAHAHVSDTYCSDLLLRDIDVVLDIIYAILYKKNESIVSIDRNIIKDKYKYVQYVFFNNIHNFKYYYTLSEENTFCLLVKNKKSTIRLLLLRNEGNIDLYPCPYFSDYFLKIDNKLYFKIKKNILKYNIKKYQKNYNEKYLKIDDKTGKIFKALLYSIPISLILWVIIIFI